MSMRVSSPAGPGKRSSPTEAASSGWTPPGGGDEAAGSGDGPPGAPGGAGGASGQGAQTPAAGVGFGAGGGTPAGCSPDRCSSSDIPSSLSAGLPAPWEEAIPLTIYRERAAIISGRGTAGLDEVGELGHHGGVAVPAVGLEVGGIGPAARLAPEVVESKGGEIGRAVADGAVVVADAACGEPRGVGRASAGGGVHQFGGGIGVTAGAGRAL